MPSQPAPGPDAKAVNASKLKTHPVSSINGGQYEIVRNRILGATDIAKSEEPVANRRFTGG
jgi:hypothetical protein